MNREWVAGVASRAYPASIRAERGGELVGTLLEAGEGSWTAFLRQVWSVLAGGLAARSREALTRPLAQTATCALMWAAVMVLVQQLVVVIGFEIRATGQVRFSEGVFVVWVLPALSIAAFTLKRTRTAGVLGVVWVVWGLLARPAPLPARVLAELLVPLAGFALMVLAPRQLPSASRWIWLLPTAVLALFYMAGIGLYSGVDLIVPLAVVLCFLPFQPSFAIGTEFAWTIFVVVSQLSFFGFGDLTAFSIVVMACVPVAILAAGFGRMRARSH